MTCYRSGGCGPYEMLSCTECPASKPEYLQRYTENTPVNWQRFPYNKKPLADSTLRHASKDVLIQIIRDYEHNYAALYEANERGIKAATELLPKKGKWRYQVLSVPGGKGQTYSKWSCSQCKAKFKKRSKFCPECGADMREDS